MANTACASFAVKDTKPPFIMMCESTKSAPMPNFNFPDRTVTNSVSGCTCGPTKNPDGNISRITNGPGWLGSPYRIAILAPAPSPSGAACQTTSSRPETRSKWDEWSAKANGAKPSPGASTSPSTSGFLYGNNFQSPSRNRYCMVTTPAGVVLYQQNFLCLCVQ